MPTGDIFNKITTSINRLVDIVTTGSLGRNKLLDGLNFAFEEGYFNGELRNLCKVTTDIGNPKYRHELSHGLRTGLKLTIINDGKLTKHEIIEYGNCLVCDLRFVKKMMSLGYDTLTLQPKNQLNDFKYLQIALKKFADLNNYMIE